MLYHVSWFTTYSLGVLYLIGSQSIHMPTLSIGRSFPIWNWWHDRDCIVSEWSALLEGSCPGLWDSCPHMCTYSLL